MTTILSREEECEIAKLECRYKLLSDDAKVAFEDAIAFRGPSPALVAALFLCIGFVMGWLG